MRAKFVITWVLGHPAVTVLLMLVCVGGGNEGAGIAFFAWPLAIGAFQATLLRANVRPYLWVAASIVGFFASFLFVCLFIFAIGFTMSFAQAFCFRGRFDKVLIGLVWTISGAVGWVTGFVLLGLLDKVMPSNYDGNKVDLRFVIPICCLTVPYAVALLPSLMLVSRCDESVDAKLTVNSDLTQ